MSTFDRTARMADNAAVRRAAAAVIVLVGCRGIWLDASLGVSPQTLLRAHALFGLLLCLSVMARFHWAIITTSGARPADIRVFARREARTVYLLLYGLMGFEQCIGIATHVRYPPETFQVYLAYGVLALLVIQALARFNRYAAR